MKVISNCKLYVTFPGSPFVKNLPAMRETWVWSLCWVDPLEEGKAAHSSIVAWRTPWTEEPRELWFIVLQRAVHNWVRKHSTAQALGKTCMCVCVCVFVRARACTRAHAQSCPTFSDPMDYSLPGSSVHGIFQTRILEWVAISYFRGSSPPRDWTLISCISSIGRWVL